MLKPSWKSLEGQAVGTTLLSCLFILYNLLFNDSTAVNDNTLKLLLEHAKSASDIANIYKDAYISNDMSKTGVTGGILFFLYFMISRFANLRNELKKQEIKNIHVASQMNINSADEKITSEEIKERRITLDDIDELKKQIKQLKNSLSDISDNKDQNNIDDMDAIISEIHNNKEN